MEATIILNYRLRPMINRRKDLRLKIVKGYTNKEPHYPHKLKIDYIQKVVCEYFNVPIEMIQSNTRKREIVQARQVAMFFAMHMTKATCAFIGANIGNKDHATVTHSVKTITNLMETDRVFMGKIEELGKIFRG